ncbi:MAG TPA: hypothetical protein VN702_02695 [Acetobacteraceae bacterium]|nr:hypothetical protein [Acetobacteraceae bacterium]
MDDQDPPESVITIDRNSHTGTGRVSLTPAQLSMLLEGIDWRMPTRVRRPELAG